MTSGKRNVAASVAARLLNQARQMGDDYQTLLTAYAYERFLYRLGISNLRDRFVLKGALLLRLWSDRPYRATRDLDLLRTGDGSFDAIRADLRTVCEVAVAPDGIVFEADTIRIVAIRAEDEYAGTRATLLAHCGSARLPLQVDMGLADAVWPPPEPVVNPSLLDFSAPEVLAYPREAVVAEKLEALVVLGDRNTRIKDFFDLHHLASRFAFDRATLTEAVRRTFARRATPIPAEAPIGLTPAYWENPSRPAQVRALAQRAGLETPEDPGRELGELLGAFLLPILEDLRLGAPGTGSWPVGGPWQPGTNAHEGDERRDQRDRATE
ncbi:MAG: nucleotidyl transferase AbiEii/AbiGii toxin family protein [Thermoanaerobaculia bacterium]